MQFRQLNFNRIKSRTAKHYRRSSELSNAPFVIRAFESENNHPAQTIRRNVQDNFLRNPSSAHAVIIQTRIAQQDVQMALA